MFGRKQKQLLRMVRAVLLVVPHPAEHAGSPRSVVDAWDVLLHITRGAAVTDEDRRVARVLVEPHERPPGAVL